MTPEQMIEGYKAALTKKEKDDYAHQLMCLIIKDPVTKYWRFTLKELPDEVWVPIKGFEDLYEISNYGRLKHLPRFRNYSKGKKIMYGEKISEYRPSIQNYARTALRKDNEIYQISIHVVVGLHFLEPVEGKDWINHKDGNKRNNHVSNLEWSTYGENNKHARDTGLNNSVSENHALAKITNIDAFGIFKSSSDYKELAKAYGLSPSNISCIKTGKTWGAVTGKVYQRKKSTRTKKYF